MTVRVPGKRSTAGALMLAIGLAGGMTARPALGETPIRETIQVRVGSKAGLRHVKVEYFDTKTGKTLAKSGAITDLWLRLWSDTGDIREIVARPNAATQNPMEAAMTVELFSVVGGRLHSDLTGTCAPFSGDTSWCRYGCDGQGFLLKRVSTKDSYDLRILLAAKAPRYASENAPRRRGPLMLTLCGADDDGLELLVVPAGGKAEDEIKLENK